MWLSSFVIVLLAVCAIAQEGSRETTVDEQDKCLNQGGFFAGETCCVYFACHTDGKRATQRVCPQPTVWNQAICACDYIYNLPVDEFDQCVNDDLCYLGKNCTDIHDLCTDDLVATLLPDQCCQAGVIYTKVDDTKYTSQLDAFTQVCPDGTIFKQYNCSCGYEGLPPQTYDCLQWNFDSGAVVENGQNTYTDPGNAFVEAIIPKFPLSRAPYVVLPGPDPITVPSFIKRNLGSEATISLWVRISSLEGSLIGTDDWKLFIATGPIDSGITGRKKRQLGLPGGGLPGGGGDALNLELSGFGNIDGGDSTTFGDAGLGALAAGSGQWYHVAMTWNKGTRRVYNQGLEVDAWTSFINQDVKFGTSGLVIGGNNFIGDMDEILVCDWAMTGAMIQDLVSGVIPSRPVGELAAGTG